MEAFITACLTNEIIGPVRPVPVLNLAGKDEGPVYMTFNLPGQRGQHLPSSLTGDEQVRAGQLRASHEVVPSIQTHVVQSPSFQSSVCLCLAPSFPVHDLKSSGRKRWVRVININN